MPSEDFDRLLSEAAARLRNDFISGARQMADIALADFAHLIEVAGKEARRKDGLWDEVVRAVKVLSKARPSMSAAVSTCLLRALKDIRDADMEKYEGPKEAAHMWALITKNRLDKRRGDGERIGRYFKKWLEELYNGYGTQDSPFTILTLSNSSTIRAALTMTLVTDVPLHIRLLVLESRPRCEGADLASALLSSLPQPALSRLTLCIMPDCAVATAARSADVILLGADRILANGDVSNKIGSLTAVLCAKASGKGTKGVRVVVASDEDKIITEGKGNTEAEGDKEVHPEEELMGAWGENARRVIGDKVKTQNDAAKVEVFGEWFEWVDGGLVDAYVTENGVLDAEGVRRVAGEAEELERRIFGEIESR